LAFKFSPIKDRSQCRSLAYVNYKMLGLIIIWGDFELTLDTDKVGNL